MPLHDDGNVIEAAGRVMAEKALECVRVTAKREIITHIRDRLQYSFTHTPSGPEKDHTLWARDYIQAILDNEANWRY